MSEDARLPDLLHHPVHAYILLYRILITIACFDVSYNIADILRCNLVYMCGLYTRPHCTSIINKLPFNHAISCGTDIVENKYWEITNCYSV